MLKPANSFRDKFERYIAQDRHNPDLRRKAYTAIAAKMARTIHAVIKSGEPYRPFFEGASPSGRTSLCRAVEAHTATSQIQGKVVHRVSVESSPVIIREHLFDRGLAFGRIGLEAGPLSSWLYAGLVDVGRPAILVETRHMHAALSARINKTDRNDALGIAQMMRDGLFKPVAIWRCHDARCPL